MILVAGESLIDLIVGPNGEIHASPGGGPFNAARTMARLGQPTRFLGQFSADPFGQLLTDRLVHDEVELARTEPVSVPTALAVVAVGAGGIPRYWFHLAGTAGFRSDLVSADCVLEPGVTALHVGTLGLVIEPMAAAVEQLVADLPRSVLLLVDPNCRPEATPDGDGYRARIRQTMARADIAKTSVEDLAFLVPDRSVADAARTVLEWGARCVLVTDGPSAVRAFTGDEQLTAPVPPVTVVDTVGAGDAFGGGFLAWWVEHGLGRDGLADPLPLLAAVRAAAQVAALTCTKPGAEPPWRHELDGSVGWDGAGWDGAGWDGAGWDGAGWDGAGWDGAG
jgi:fructokinase